MSLRPILAARTRRTALVLAILALLALMLGGSVSEAVATTFTVNSADDVDDGTCDAAHCSLREAINAANTNPGTDTVAFNIPGAGPHTIQPASALPTITDPVVIDGYTQPGASPNTNGPGLGLNTVLKIELDGSLAGSLTDGLRITSGNSTVRGLVINRFSLSGIRVVIGGGNVIEGNFIGTDVTGTVGLGNPDDGVRIIDAPDNRIGGATPAARNLISGNDGTAGSFQGDGVEIFGSSAAGNVVQGNFIGIDVTGTSALPNAAHGVRILFAPTNTIGGVATGAGNVISGNAIMGVDIFGGSATGNVLQGNFIGTDVTGTVNLGNAGNGILINSGPVTIGGMTAGARNVISGNDGFGVAIVESDGHVMRGNTIAFNDADGVFVETGTGNAVLSNSIFSNTGLGIDLAPDGATPNDVGDGDTGSNNRQNFPVLTLAASGSTLIEGTLNSASNTEFRIELFSNSACDPSGHGEGETLVGSTMVTTDGSGNAAFSVISGATVPVGHFITATATDPDNNTSEFSQCMVVGEAATPIPTPTNTRTPTPTDTPTPTPTPPPEMSLGVTGNVTCDDPSKPTKCTALFDEAAGFQLIVNAVVIPEGGYAGFASEVVGICDPSIDSCPTDLLTYTQRSCVDEVVWPSVALCLRFTGGAGQAQHGTGTGVLPPFPKSNFTGTLVELDVQCPAEDFFEIVLTVLGDTNSEPIGSPFGAHYVDLDGNPVAVKPVGERELDLDGDGELDGVDYGIADALLINCVNIPPTPTPTPTDTPTATPTPTAPFPRWLKQDRYPITEQGSQGNPNPQDPALDDLSNLWLTRQGSKIPPLRCEDSTDNAVFSEVLGSFPASPDPKGVHSQQFLGGFEFEVRFDNKLVCINLEPGSVVKELGMICFIDDKDTSQLEGIARMGCVIKGKTKSEPSGFKGKGPELARVWVKPQPELYSLIRANQDNGIVVILLDQDCELADEQGHPIPISSCEDAAVTIRYLEGDVEPDCFVDALDQQAIAFRWGAQKGSVLYNERYDLEPSGTVKGDGDIDIKDLQFVFGRHGSSCGRGVQGAINSPLKALPTEPGAPHPRQAPVNPQT